MLRQLTRLVGGGSGQDDQVPAYNFAQRKKVKLPDDYRRRAKKTWQDVRYLRRLGQQNYTLASDPLSAIQNRKFPSFAVLELYMLDEDIGVERKQWYVRRDLANNDVASKRFWSNIQRLERAIDGDTLFQVPRDAQTNEPNRAVMIAYDALMAYVLYTGKATEKNYEMTQVRINDFVAAMQVNGSEAERQVINLQENWDTLSSQSVPLARKQGAAAGVIRWAEELYKLYIKRLTPDNEEDEAENKEDEDEEKKDDEQMQSAPQSNEDSDKTESSVE